MAAEPTKVEDQVAGEAPTVAPTEPAPQAAETKVADAAPPAESAAVASTDGAADAAPAAEAPAAVPAAVPAPAQDASAKEESKEEQKEEPKEEPSAKEEPKETPLTKLANRLPAIKEKAGHDEMWGVTLVDIDHAPTAVVLQKFLRANGGDVALAESQLTSALEWRKTTNPAALLDEKAYDQAKFGDLGYVTTHEGSDGKQTIITWNIYGAVKNNKATFGDIKEFLDWRVALMELGMRKLNIDKATTAIPDGAEDPYQMVQVHDYQSVSFLRMDPHIKAASKVTIQTLSMAYPEVLSHKYFVNVPTIMGWVFSALKLFLSPATLRKFHPLSSGAGLAGEIPAFASSLPKEYGGSGPGVKEGLTVKLTEAPVSGEAEKADEPAAAAATAEDSTPKADDAPQEAPKEEVKEESKEEAKEEAKEVPAAEAKPEEAAAKNTAVPAEAAPAGPTAAEVKA
ncbi:related to SFH5 - phospholipid transporter [Cephalotrichum gorgonifer]|uniref:Phosphatidylinositol transfer protein SFH5 n=1 Tax=Cephalotrichum gorgonifer TaxID=2041049 RepID=A0AAE8SWG2_9PEZI|nr:related to SFH5 - phospholipid transporter [Cephalotrichum gorgonifer]